MELKLFVWDTDDVLRDYTSGMIFVLAENHSQALRLIEEKDSVCM